MRQCHRRAFNEPVIKPCRARGVYLLGKVQVRAVRENKSWMRIVGVTKPSKLDDAAKRRRPIESLHPLEANMMGATKIGLWGIDMAATEEYAYQRPGCQHFLGLVKRAGIDPKEVDDVIVGAALQQGSTGSNVARQAALRAGLPQSVAGMSVAERVKTAELLNRIIKDRSVLVIEHDMKFVEDIAHRVTVLHQGKVLSEGSMERVKTDPKVVEVYLGH